jgi:HPt (histidine-containing phosphotransfer) domain-containing protein
MPEMDGYQLTTAIRADEHTTHRHIPIIALTANALHGEAERCLEIGMDDFVVKPVDLRAFRSTLKRWMPAAASSPATGDTQTKTPAAVKGRAVFDVSVLERLVDGDPEAVQGILKGFEASARRGMATVRTACESHVADQVVFGAHMMKSPANTVGAMVMADICVALEKAAPTEDWPHIETLVTELDSTLETLVTHINAKLRSLEQVA